MKKRIRGIFSIIFVLAYIVVGYSNAFAVERVNILPATTREKAPSGNVFQLKGSTDKFILLADTAEGYFVLAEKYCAKKSISVDGNPVPFDPKDKNSIAYWLNNDYLTDTTLATRLPQVIIDNLVERAYATEGGGSSVPFSADYTSVCKVVLLSQTEWSKYNARFGYADDASSAYWALRSVRSLTGSPLVAATSGSNGGLTVDGKWSSSLGIRPAFYLASDFFEKASVDLENTGDEILSIIRKKCGKGELNEMYNSAEVFTLTETDIAPTSDSVTITGRGIVGEKITGTYKFVSLDNNAENGTQIQWLKSRDGKTWSTILGAETTEFVPTVNEIDHYIKMKVTPMTHTMAGASIESTVLGCKIRDISKPQASNVVIKAGGAVKPGTILDVKYIYSDENRDICSETGYIWESAADNAGTESKQIGNKRYLKLTNAEAGKYIRVGVIPKKQTNSADGRKVIEGDAVFTDWVKVENLPVASGVEVTRKANVTAEISKTEDTISIKGILTNAGDTNTETLTASYTVENGEGYSVVCEWQGANSKDGEYGLISAGSNVLNYVPENAMWVRAKVYTESAGQKSYAVYSEPFYMGENKASDNDGEYALTKELTAGKKYEIWIANEALRGSYTYSFKLISDSVTGITSDKYLVRTINQSDGLYVIGTMLSNKYSNDVCFKAGEIIPEKNGVITISDVLTTSVEKSDEHNVSRAKVFVVEK